MSEITYGSKYNKDMDVKDIAKLVRQDIKASIKAGRLPKGTKTSVRISRYSMGRSLVISVISLGDVIIDNPARKQWDQDNRHAYYGNAPSRFTPEATEAFAHMSEIVAAYNFDGSDSMTDYYHVNFSSHITYHSSIVG